MIVMDVDKLLAIGAGVLITVGALGIGAFTALQDIDVRQSVEGWANDNGLTPIVQIIEILTN